MRAVCFGDSNTYGYDACSLFGDRLPRKERWTDILGDLSGWEIINEGMNGREIPTGYFLQRFWQILEGYAPIDKLFLMLGSNDILNGGYGDYHKVSKRMEELIQYILHSREGSKSVFSRCRETADITIAQPQIILASPPQMRIGQEGSLGKQMEAAAEALREEYCSLAKQYGLLYMDVGGWKIPLAYDGVHFTGDGHRLFAEKVWETAWDKV
ncbi:GDSL-type esterase/lipase family protein [Lachnospiraceae bacterium 62-35]